MAGDWDGNGFDSAGVYRPSEVPTTASGTCATPLPPPADFIAFAPLSNQIAVNRVSVRKVSYIIPSNRLANYKPQSGEVVDGLAKLHQSARATLPINVGTIPAGKQVTITLDVVVNKPILKDYVSVQGTVTGSNFTTVLTDDPDTNLSNDPTLTPIDLSSVKLPATGERAWGRDLSPQWGVAVGVVLVGVMLRRMSRRLRNR